MPSWRLQWRSWAKPEPGLRAKLDELSALNATLRSCSHDRNCDDLARRPRPVKDKGLVALPGTPITPRKQLVRMAGRMFCVSLLRHEDGAMLEHWAECDAGQRRILRIHAAPKFDREGYYTWMKPHLAHPHWAVVPDENWRLLGTAARDGEDVAAPQNTGRLWHLIPIEYLFDLYSDWPRVCIGSSGRVLTQMVRPHGAAGWIMSLTHWCSSGACRGCTDCRCSGNLPGRGRWQAPTVPTWAATSKTGSFALSAWRSASTP